QTIPDSYYSVDFTGTETDRRLSVVASPGGPLPASGAPEPASRVVGFIGQEDQSGALAAVNTPLGAAGIPENGDNTGDITYEALSPQLGDVRLVAGQGDDAAANPRDVRDGIGVLPDPDGVIDWAVGEVTAS